jgi:YD repeat-containing protein
MKSAHLLLTSLLALSLGTPHLKAQTAFSGSTANINPNPANCCECLNMAVSGNLVPEYAKDGTFINRLYPDLNGNYWAIVDVSVGNDPDCLNQYNYLLLGTVEPTGKKVSAETVPKTGLVTKSETVRRVYKLEPNKAKIGDKWRIELKCGVDIDTPDEVPPSMDLEGAIPYIPKRKDECRHLVEFVLDGCSACEMNCGKTGLPSASNGSFRASIPMTTSNGGHTEGELAFIADDFSNPGRSALYANLPLDVPVNFDGNGRITSVMTGANTIEIFAADPGILALDPNAFTVVHKDGSGFVFRTTTISFVTEAGVSKLRMDSNFDGATTRYEQTMPQPDTYIMEQGRVVGGDFQVLSRETLFKQLPSGNTRIQRISRQERATVNDLFSTISDVETTWEMQITGWRKTKEIIDPDGAALTSTWSYYQPGETTGPNGASEGLGEIKNHVRYDGYQAFYSYSLHQTTISSPYAGDSTGQVETTTWNPATKTMTTINMVLGQVVSKETTIHTDTTETNVVFTSGSDTLTTVTHYMPSNADFGGKPSLMVRPDGTITTYAYTRNAGGGFTTVMEDGSSTNGTTVAKGTRTISTTNSRGTTILNKTEAIGYGTGSAVFGSMAVTSVDNLGRALVTAHYPTSAVAAGEVATATGAAWTTTTDYSCCGVAKETDMYGIPTFHAYDHLQRQIKTNRLGVTTEIVRNGLTTETHRYSETVSASLSPALNGTPATLVSKSVSNLAGTLQESWSPDPTSTSPGALVKSSSTVTTYQPAAGLSTRTVTTTPDNFTQTTDSFLDGRTAATYGALSPAMSYSYTVNSIGEVTSQSYVDGSELRETTTSQSDWAGRTLSTTLMDGATSTMTYNSIGQMTSSIDPDGITTLYAYNAEGERTITAIDLNANGLIDYGVDTVSYSESEHALDGSNPVIRTISKVWQPGDTSPSGGTLVSTSTRAPNGLSSSSQSIGVANPSTSLTTLAGNGNWTTTSTSPDGTKQVQTYTAGLLASSSSLLTDHSALITTSFAYDALNRPITQTDSRTGPTTTTYLSTTSDAVASVTAPGTRTTAFTYDIRGRHIAVDAPDSLDADGNTLANITTTSYNPDSTVAETNGDQTYRTTHTYDYAQRQVTMTTYGTENATTYWHYSPTRGYLTRKAYHDTGNGSKGTDYTYTAAGRLSTRAWARGVGTAYTYDGGGRLTATTYSDDTPDVAVTYDALGRQLTQTNGTATTTYAYDSATLALDTETITYNLPGADPFTRVLDRSRDNLNRDTGWQLKVGSTIENSVTYAYGATDGRLSEILNPEISNPFTYSYLTNSNLLHTITGPHPHRNQHMGSRSQRPRLQGKQSGHHSHFELFV